MSSFSEAINSSFKDNRVKAMLNILYTANWISSHQNEFFKQFGLSPQQYNILRILRGAKQPIKVQTIKERMVERAPNLTRLTDKLCDKNLIERIPFEGDRRVVLIGITKQGLELLEKIDPQSPQLNLLKNLNEEEANQLSDLLDKMRN
ncbi:MULTISPECIES: MarR family winged helix-turn-helix transcriptional regulator [Mesoflavibacter]|uniref:MarR family transcriptional regulator n=1 Tax=Mesoflavibacter zeaxanthinifaciens subsp. sabulilitoris TaxID=1520893 RepID=A0A2T1NGU8_9FLAO|nr:MULTISPECIES: MarR family transcriptional regulator [Mesoflavibacter]MBB3122820.1 DNA-binding MarR family transcriptional regulator [Mesoflavibacter zeaxanthinifaciens subsp. sabulilitoris]PSG92099.1 MarR family transcriptional regulator [Mesoflavibacter zeaxanthinifaciens subsp. sabulilitoris]UAB75280.1 MarR family transcriptional regulator [Mesoflavibacter sp. SCSIO 43206]